MPSSAVMQNWAMVDALRPVGAGFAYRPGHVSQLLERTLPGRSLVGCTYRAAGELVGKPLIVIRIATELGHHPGIVTLGQSPTRVSSHQDRCAQEHCPTDGCTADQFASLLH
jgi:hypothetical protein